MCKIVVDWIGSSWWSATPYLLLDEGRCVLSLFCCSASLCQLLSSNHVVTQRTVHFHPTVFGFRSEMRFTQRLLDATDQRFAHGRKVFGLDAVRDMLLYEKESAWWEKEKRHPHRLSQLYYYLLPSSKRISVNISMSGPSSPSALSITRKRKPKRVDGSEWNTLRDSILQRETQTQYSLWMK
jgi:hypothetical protein